MFMNIPIKFAKIPCRYIGAAYTNGPENYIAHITDPHKRHHTLYLYLSLN